jgi:hypothetical protein
MKAQKSLMSPTRPRKKPQTRTTEPRKNPKRNPKKTTATVFMPQLAEEQKAKQRLSTKKSR